MVLRVSLRSSIQGSKDGLLMGYPTYLRGTDVKAKDVGEKPAGGAPEIRKAFTKNVVNTTVELGNAVRPTSSSDLDSRLSINGLFTALLSSQDPCRGFEWTCNGYAALLTASPLWNGADCSLN